MKKSVILFISMLLSCSLYAQQETTSPEVHFIPVTPSSRTQSVAVQDGKVYERAEIQPCFPGGVYAMQKWVSSHLKYPKEAKKQGIEGRVLVSFVVEKDGKVDNVKVVESAHELLDIEAIRVINDMPRWEPGQIGGQPVRVQFHMPVNFRK